MVGKILAIYPAPRGNLAITAPKTFSPGKTDYFKITVLDESGKAMPGVQPLKVSITDPRKQKSEFSGYFAAVDGVAEIKFIPAVNDASGEWTISMTELGSGKNRTIKWILNPH